MWRTLPLLVLLAACGSGTPPQPPARAGATDARLHEIGVLTTDRAFRRAVAGKSFAADGYLMHFSPDGSWTARRGDLVHAGSWTYDSGLLCHSYTLDPRAETRRCYRAALHDDELLLVPKYERGRIARF